MRVDLMNKRVPVYFRGEKEVEEFRKAAKNVIDEFDHITLCSSEYTDMDESGKSPKTRLLQAIFIDCEKLGEEFITEEDRALHEKLKGLYKEYQEFDDYMEASCGGGGKFVNRTVDYYI